MSATMTTEIRESVAAMLEESRKATQAGAINASLLLVWGAVESALQQATEQARLPATVLISYAFNRGVLDQTEYTFLMQTLHDRDAVAHGSRQATEPEIHALARLAERMSLKDRTVSSTATLRPVREIVGGETYDYYPLGEYVVRALGVCGGRPTFKYTRIEVEGLLQRLAAGEAFYGIVEKFEGSVSAEALQEAIDIRARPLLNDISMTAIH